MAGERWQPGLLDAGRTGGWALAHCRQQFLADGNGVLFPREWLKRQDLPILSEHGIGHFDGDEIYLLELASTADVPGMLGFATQIGTWADHHRFCGSCGARMSQVSGERAMHCQSCGVHHYPRLSPSMIVLVTRGDELLLARSPRFVSGVYSTLAGFVEPGESVEQCVAREVREEVGVEIATPQYIGSQNWPFPHSLMLGFHAEYVSGDIVPQPGEIEDAQWFSIHDLPPLPASKSIARYLIDLYLARRLGHSEPVLPG